MLDALWRSFDRLNLKKDRPNRDNAFKPMFEKILICDNGLDNSPENFVFGSAPNETAFFISQSRSPGHKNIGQDCVATAQHGDWEVNVLCDGHDLDGHMVSRDVCKTLPSLILEEIFSRSPAEVPEMFDEALLVRAFEKTSNSIGWTEQGVCVGKFVKVFGGQWGGKVGFIDSSKDSHSSVVIIVDSQGYHRPVIENKYMRCARYSGGSTCVCMVRNVRTGKARIAFTGDSRLLLLKSGVFDDPVMKPMFGLQTYDKAGEPTVPPMAMTILAHNVYSKDELLRLNTYHAGDFEIEGAFLVNPVTKFAIQPTRGFGDFDMFGTGYTNEPEVSSAFQLDEGVLVFCASDGVFDEHVWKDDELVTFLDTMLAEASANSKPVNAKVIGETVYKQTFERSLAGGYVDDISLFCFVAPKPQPNLPYEPCATGEPAAASATGEPAAASATGEPAAASATGEPAAASATGEPAAASATGEPAAASATGEPAVASATGAAAEVSALSKPKPKCKASLVKQNFKRKSLMQRLWHKGKFKLERSGSLPEEFAGEASGEIMPDVEKPMPEDWCRTINRKNVGPFALLMREQMEDEAGETNVPHAFPSEQSDKDEKLAQIVVDRVANRYGYDTDQEDVSHSTAIKACMSVCLE